MEISRYIVTNPFYNSMVFLEMPRIQLGKYILLRLTDTCGTSVLSDCQRSMGDLLGHAKTQISISINKAHLRFTGKNELNGFNSKLDKGVGFQLADKKVKERRWC